MKKLLIEQNRLATLAAQHQTALTRAAADIERLTELQAQHAKLSANRQDRIAAAFLADTTADTQAIDAELDTMANQIAALSDSKATHALLNKQLANVQGQQEKNQTAINKIIADRMAAQFAEAEDDFKQAATALSTSLVKMKSALHITRMVKGNYAPLLGEYQEYVFGMCVRGLPTHASRDVLADEQVAEMLENLRNEEVIL